MFKMIVIGTSMGGLSALEAILTTLPANFAVPIAIVQHISPDAGKHLIQHFQQTCHLSVKEAEDLETIQSHCIYFAPPGYHLMIEAGGTFSLCVGEKISYSRPSIDVLFHSAARIYHEQLLGIILTGANHDGTAGAKSIKSHGGTVIVQDPATAEAKYMPISAIKSGFYDKILSLDDIAALIRKQQLP
jgi:two-component system chemotaxis response regulator CheB